MLEAQVGTSPDAILEAAPARLARIVRRGGAIAVTQRAARLQKIADRVATRWKGNLRPVLRLPFEAARRELAQYPSIGPAGAERVLLLSGSHPVLGLDSNALRVLLRLGYGREFPQWAKTHRVVQEAAERELPATIAARRPAYLLLRRHGQTLCRRSAPRCSECPLQPDCPTGRARVA
jgi:endonuclease III